MTDHELRPGDEPDSDVGVAILDSLREPMPAARWAEPATVRRAGQRRRQRRRSLIALGAAAVATAVALPLAGTGGAGAPSGPPHALAAGAYKVIGRSGPAAELAAATVPEPVRDPSAEQAVATAEQQLTLSLLSKIKPDGGPNVLFSPSSLATALSMLSLGAGGETQRQILDLLGPSGASAATVASGWSSLTADWAAAAKAGGITLSSANSLWLQQGIQMVPTFMSDLARYFADGVWQVDFARDPAGAVAALNKWVATETRGHITKLLDPSDAENLVLCLVNAVYLNADWATAFTNPDSPEPFTLAGGQVIDTPTIEDAFVVPVSTGKSVDAVQLPYRGGRFAALMIEPKTTDLASFTRNLTPAGLNQIVASLHTDSVSLSMPTLDFGSGEDLKTPLQRLGVTDAFTSGADLRPTSPDVDYVKFVKQKATLTVDSKGTTATAATAVGEAMASLRAGRELVKLDHPYLFLVRDTKTGAIMFAAQINDPRH